MVHWRSAVVALAALICVFLAGASARGLSGSKPMITNGNRLGYPSGPSGPSPSWPGWGPSPPAHGEELPLTSGMVVNIQSHTLQTYCNVGPASAKPFPYPLSCAENGSSMVSQGLLLIGKDYITSKLYDGSVVQLKAQRENKVCSYGAEEQRFPITCEGMDSGPTSDFVIKRALARPDLYYLAPAIIPSHKCYPAHSPPTHGMPVQAHRVEDALADHHVMVCDGQADGDSALLHITQADFWKPPAATPEVLSAAATSAREGKQGGLVPQLTTAVWTWLAGLLAPNHLNQPQHAPVQQYSLGYPYYPGPPGGGGAFPFGAGSMLQLADPSNDAPDAPVCDVLSTGGDDDDDDARQVTCDHDPPPPGQWGATSGFIVLTASHRGREVMPGDQVLLQSLATHRYCVRSGQPNGVMTCGAANKTAQALFRVEAAEESPDSASLRTPSGSSNDGDVTQVVLHLLHVASNRYCGVDLEDFDLPLACDYDAEHHGKPKVLVKVTSAWAPSSSR